MNVLLTSVGRRSYLVRYFQEALRGRGEVVVTNSVPDAPGMHVADRSLVVPASCEAGYPETVIGICERFGIGLLCSCHDLDTLALAPMRDRLRAIGVRAMLPDADWARVALDKFACGERLRGAGFGVPWASVDLEETRRALATGRVGYPLLIKARYGFGSAGLDVCSDDAELEVMARRWREGGQAGLIARFLGEGAATVSQVVFQEKAVGPEWCLGLVHDLEGNPAAHFLCEVHSMRAGESDRVSTVQGDLLGDLPERLSALTRHMGIWGVDVLANGGRPLIIDLNPRFTGDYPFQHLAGANVPAALVAWARGEVPDPAWLRPAVGVRGYKDLVPMRIGGGVSETRCP